MRRFVQAFSPDSGISSSLPSPVAAALADLPARYNISIGLPAGVLFIREGHWKIANMAWGLIPSWEPLPATRYSTQTARLERAPRSRMYRRAWADRRCAIPMNGYYKWDRGTPRLPWFIQATTGDVLFAAGLWSLWGEEQGESVLSFSILTHPNSAIPAPLVADGPLFLPASSIAEWINSAPDAAARMLRRATQPALEAYRVGRRVANRKLDDYALLEPASPEETDPEPDEHDVEDDD